MAYSDNETAFTQFEARQMSPAIGAELIGADLTKPTDTLVSEVRAALLRYKVVFFRDQDITRAQHLAFARKFGELEIHPATPKEQPDREVLRIAHGPNSRGVENSWHSDVTWREEPSLGSILRAIELPPVGGDTLFECSSYDKLVIFSKDGRYWVMPPPERFFVDGGMMLAGKADRDQEYTMVYTDSSSGFTYMKRFTLGGFILEKEYRAATEGATVLLLQTGVPETIYVKYKPAKAQRIHQQMFQPTDIMVKSAKARGNQMTAKRIARIDTTKPRWWNDEDEAHKGHLL